MPSSPNGYLASSDALDIDCDPAVLTLLAQAEHALAEGAPERALALCAEAVGLDERCARAHELLGDACVALRRLRDARAAYDRACQLFLTATVLRKRDRIVVISLPAGE